MPTSLKQGRDRTRRTRRQDCVAPAWCRSAGVLGRPRLLGGRGGSDASTETHWLQLLLVDSGIDLDYTDPAHHRNQSSFKSACAARVSVNSTVGLFSNSLRSSADCSMLTFLKPPPTRTRFLE